MSNENLAQSSITFWMEEDAQKVNISYTFDTYGLSFEDFFRACRGAALAFGYSENLVNEFFSEDI